MTAKIQQWGNSQGIRLPKVILDSLDIQLNDEVEIEQSGDKLLISKKKYKSRKNIAELFADYNGSYQSDELDWGMTEGKEIW